MSAVTEHRLGSNTVKVEGDTLLITEQSRWKKEDMQALTQLTAQVRAEQGRVFAITVVKSPISVDADARRYVSEWARGNDAELVVMVGAGVAAKAVTMLLFRASEIISGRHFPLIHCDTLEEAHQIVSETRARLIGNLGG